jgi:SulP family sulfate permease
MGAGGARQMPDGTATARIYLPKLVTVLREGYDVSDLRRDAVAGFTVAIVALPLDGGRWGPSRPA